MPAWITDAQVWLTIGIVYLGAVLVAGLGAGVAEHFGWIKSKRLRRVIRKLYGLDRPDPRRHDQDDD